MLSAAEPPTAIPLRKPSGTDNECRARLLGAVPATARRILVVSCGEGGLGAALKGMDEGRQVFVLDAAQTDPPVEPGTIDCIVYHDVLGRLTEPGEVLWRHRRLLSEGGVALCSLTNVQHHTHLTALLKSDFPHGDPGLLGAPPSRPFTYSTAFKLLLNSGLAPHLVDTVDAECPGEFLAAASPLLEHLGLSPERTRKYLNASQYVIKGTPVEYYGEPADPPDVPLTFVVCVSDEESLRANLLSSPCLREGFRHEVLMFRGCASAAEGLNAGIERAKNSLVVCVHQDVYLPRGWPARFGQQYRLVEKRIGKVGVVGVFGAARVDGATRFAGHVVDRDALLKEGHEFPAVVDTLDELLLALPRDTPLRFEPALGFHLYGSDIALAARRSGLNAVAVDALCFHHSHNPGPNPPAFWASALALASKWSDCLPISTSCAWIDERWRTQYLAGQPRPLWERVAGIGKRFGWVPVRLARLVRDYLRKNGSA